jgi:hypothetical protein
MRIIKLLALIAVSSFLFACGDDGGFFVPVATGNKTFNANGGSADASLSGSGGFGGGIFMDVYGDVKVRKTGTLNTSFTLPSYDNHFGSNKATVSVNTAIKLQGTDTIVAGDLFLNPNDATLYISDGETGTVVTGLEVKSGVTLTVPVNWGTWAYFVVNQSVLIDGTVRPAVDGADLDIESDSLFQVGANGLVTTKPATAGTNGGDIYLYTQGVFINKGVIDSSGANATEGDGGHAGYLEVDADGFVYNTGTLLSLGGDGTVDGGNGGWMGIYSYYASVYTSGVLDCSGGDGDAGNGGHAGAYYYDEQYYEIDGIDIYAGAGEGRNIGHLLAGGTLTANGGNGTGGNGGQAGYVYLESNGGKLWTSAAVSAKGGSSDIGGGGAGGAYALIANYGVFDNEAVVETWGIKITGNIDLAGGAGSLYGGFGGRLEVRNSFSGAGLPTFPAVEMVGYKSLTMNGGSAFYGGFGGFYRIVTRDWFSNAGVALPVGSITNSVPASLVGGAGDSAAGYGGFGGLVYFSTDIRYGHDGEVVAQNSAALNASGGDGYYCYTAGGVLIYGYDKAVNSGVITARGGNGAYGGNGANGGIKGKVGPAAVSADGPMMEGVAIVSSYDVVNSGAINGSGGFGELQGGSGGYCVLGAGNQVKNKAAITMNGGDSDEFGGFGGGIFLGSELVPTSNSGALKVFGGNGGLEDGGIGTIFIDWVDVTPI